nr:reverse transcriptase domain-containing protein [Tanacetum cinerariifolium]
MQPVAPLSPNYIPGSEEQHDPNYMPEPIYPEYIPLEDEHVFSVEEQPLPPIDSPTAESPGYVAESDPEEDLKEYEDDKSEDDSEEEEHLASADSAVVIPIVELVSPLEGTEPVIPPLSTDTTTTGARITVRLQAFIPLSPEAEVERLLAMPTLPPSPLTSISPPSVREHLASPRYEVEESSTARPTRGRGIDYGFVSTLDAEARRRGIEEVGYSIRDTWVDPAEAVPDIAPMTLGKVNTRVTELIELNQHDTQDLYALLEDAQEGRTRISQRGEIKKLEIKLWNLKVKGNNVPTYTERFQELTLICTKFVANETKKIDKYISGLPDNIYGSVKSSRPKTLDETIELANDFMDQ